MRTKSGIRSTRIAVRSDRRPGAGGAAHLLLVFLLSVPGVPSFAGGNQDDPAGALSASADSESLSIGTKFSRLDAGLLTVGGGMMAVGSCYLSSRKREVPREGLSSDEIHLGLDRNSIRLRTHRPIDVGNGLLYGTIAHPSILGIVSARPGERGSVCAQTALHHAEALLLAGGTSFVIKKVVARPRPYTYLPVYERSERGANWATSDQTFESFPSGHATTAWASSAVAVSSLAIRRADLSPTAHFLNGFVAGGLAMSASLLRVEAGMHFPTDIAMGTLLGAAAGTAVPLAHQGFRIAPRQSRSLKWGWLGIGGGCLMALLLTPPTSPWVD